MTTLGKKWGSQEIMPEGITTRKRLGAREE
jgi:hypothetical protein